MGPAGEQGEAGSEPVEQLARGEHRGARRGQLDRERQPVQPAADLPHVRIVGGGERSWIQCPSALDEEIGRRSLAERFDREDVLAGEVEHAPARDDDGEAVSSLDQAEQLRPGLGHLLEVVEHHHQLAAGGPRRERLVDRACGVLPHSERLGEGRQHESGIPETCQLDPGDAVREERAALTREREGQPALPTSARTDEAHQADVFAKDERAEIGELALSPDQGGHGRGERRGIVLGDDLRAGEGGILAQDRRLDRAEVVARFEPELLEQALARLAEHLERLDLPPGAVERDHEDPARAVLDADARR